jgi:hypothetical protein
LFYFEPCDTKRTEWWNHLKCSKQRKRNIGLLHHL